MVYWYNLTILKNSIFTEDNIRLNKSYCTRSVLVHSLTRNYFQANFRGKMLFTAYRPWLVRIEKDFALSLEISACGLGP